MFARAHYFKNTTDAPSVNSHSGPGLLAPNERLAVRPATPGGRDEISIKQTDINPPSAANAGARDASMAATPASHAPRGINRFNYS